MSCPGPYQCMSRGRHALSTGLEGSLCRLEVRLAQGRQNGFSDLLREVIVHSGASSNDVAATAAHSIHDIASSSDKIFFKNWSLSSMLVTASWRSNTVFTSFYLQHVQYIFEGVRSLGFVAAGVLFA